MDQRSLREVRGEYRIMKGIGHAWMVLGRYYVSKQYANVCIFLMLFISLAEKLVKQEQ